MQKDWSGDLAARRPGGMPHDRVYFAIAPLTGSVPLMFSTTDSPRTLKAPARRAWTFLVAALSLADLGCARLRTFQKDDSPMPMLGAATPHRSGADHHRGPDLYADRMAG